MKRGYRLTPVSVYDTAGLECWLESMARRGLFLKKFRSLFCTFTKGAPQAVRYRVEPHRRGMDDELPRSMLELYEDFGWICVDEVQRQLLIFATQDPDAPELHTDPKTQYQLWRKMYRGVLWNFWAQMLIMCVAIGAALGFLMGGGDPVYSLITTNALPLLGAGIYMLCTVPAAWAEAQMLSQTVRRLKEGMPLEHWAPYPRRRLSSLLSLEVLVVLLGLLLFAQYVLPFQRSGALPLEELDAFPLLSLAGLEGEGFQESHFVVDGVDYANFCARERYFLCWNQWEAVQSGERRPGEDYGPRLTIQWYDLALPQLSRPLAQEQLNCHMWSEDGQLWAPGGSWQVNYYPWEGDILLAVGRQEPDGVQIAAAAAGNRAVVLHYTGRGDLTGHLEEIAAMVGG